LLTEKKSVSQRFTIRLRPTLFQRWIRRLKDEELTFELVEFLESDESMFLSEEEFAKRAIARGAQTDEHHLNLLLVHQEQIPTWVRSFGLILPRATLWDQMGPRLKTLCCGSNGRWGQYISWVETGFSRHERLVRLCSE